MQDQSTASVLVCEQCGIPLSPRQLARTGRVLRYCSRQCGAASHRIDRVAWFRALVPTNTESDAMLWCQPFQGTLDDDGYGRFTIKQNGRCTTVRAHRFAYELAHGEGSADGWQVQHLCNNPPCCNPSHLVLGEPIDNTAYMIASGRAAYGNRHWSHLQPERRVRGEQHWAKRLPERIPRGEQASGHKLTAEDVRAIRAALSAGGRVGATLAQQYHVTEATISAIRRGKTWKHI